jgi:hypothetical protein
MALVHGCDFGRTRLHVDTAVTAVVADTVGGLRAVVHVVHDDVAVVIIADAGADVIDGAVVIEVVAVPVAAEVSETDVAEAVVDSSVEADMRAPVTAVEAIVDAAPAPVGRRPERAIVRRRNPFAGDPIVAIIAPGPVAGSPEIVGVRVGRLVVIWQRRRRLVGGNGGFGVRGSALVVAVVVGVVILGSGSARLDGFAGLLRLVGVALAEDGASLAGRTGCAGEIGERGIGAGGVGGGVVVRRGIAAIAAGEEEQ